MLNRVTPGLTWNRARAIPSSNQSHHRIYNLLQDERWSQLQSHTTGQGCVPCKKNHVYLKNSDGYAVHPQIEPRRHASNQANINEQTALAHITNKATTTANTVATSKRSACTLTMPAALVALVPQHEFLLKVTLFALAATSKTLPLKLPKL